MKKDISGRTEIDKAVTEIGLLVKRSLTKEDMGLQNLAYSVSEWVNMITEKQRRAYNAKTRESEGRRYIG